jgi:hypothetical protein
MCWRQTRGCVHAAAQRPSERASSTPTQRTCHGLTLTCCIESMMLNELDPPKILLKKFRRNHRHTHCTPQAPSAHGRDSRRAGGVQLRSQSVLHTHTCACAHAQPRAQRGARGMPQPRRASALPRPWLSRRHARPPSTTDTHTHTHTHTHTQHHQHARAHLERHEHAEPGAQQEDAPEVHHGNRDLLTGFTRCACARGGSCVSVRHGRGACARAQGRLACADASTSSR